MSDQKDKNDLLATLAIVGVIAALGLERVVALGILSLSGSLFLLGFGSMNGWSGPGIIIACAALVFIALLEPGMFGLLFIIVITWGGLHIFGDVAFISSEVMIALLVIALVLSCFVKFSYLLSRLPIDESKLPAELSDKERFDLGRLNTKEQKSGHVKESPIQKYEENFQKNKVNATTAITARRSVTPEVLNSGNLVTRTEVSDSSNLNAQNDPVNWRKILIVVLIAFAAMSFWFYWQKKQVALNHPGVVHYEPGPDSKNDSEVMAKSIAVELNQNSGAKKSGSTEIVIDHALQNFRGNDEPATHKSEGNSSEKSAHGMPNLKSEKLNKSLSLQDQKSAPAAKEIEIQKSQSDYSGNWRGRWSCGPLSDDVVTTVETNRNSISNEVILAVVDGMATIVSESRSSISRVSGQIMPEGKTRLIGIGSWKNGSGNPWNISFEGQFLQNRFTAVGILGSRDGAKKFRDCELELIRVTKN